MSYKEAGAKDPLYPMGTGEKFELTIMEISYILSEAVSTEGGSSVDGCVFNLESFFEKYRVGSDDGASFEKSLEDKDHSHPSRYSALCVGQLLKAHVH